MSTQTTNHEDSLDVGGGCDVPVVNRKEDHLNRWPLAREVYGIATTGPENWSVRVGIYGEWGTGKTSVLEFIGAMAQQDEQIVIKFNPWEFSTKDSLWRAFVLAVFAEPKLANIAGARKARTKGLLSKIMKRASAVESATSLLNEKVGKGVGVGLDIVRSLFSFSHKDLKSLHDALGKKRVIVLIDDLDRTAPELVPEILFALKELMNIPRFSFICAFDPVVIGQVLGRFHPGFGEGLEFLEKIIDYPRWLPPATAEGLASLAVEDARKSCARVPESAIRDAIPLLPANPRAVRQFIRLLALLEPQIQRYSEDELRWPVIVAANILKVRYPHLAHELLSDESFWGSVEMIGIAVRGENEKEELGKAIDDHIKKTRDKIGVSLDGSQEAEIKAAILTLCSQIDAFSGFPGTSVSYQLNIAEAPRAVTKKEFEAFLIQWTSNQVGATVSSWIDHHAQEIEQNRLEVYRELLTATIQRYSRVLHLADNAFMESEKPALVCNAASLFTLLEALVVDFGGLADKTKQIGDQELEMLIGKFASLANSTLPVHTEFWPRNEALVSKLVEQWSLDVMPLMRVLNPFAGVELHHVDGIAARELHKKLCALVLPNFARQILPNLRQTGFVQRLWQKNRETFDARCIIWDASGPLWGQLRAEAFQILGEAGITRAVQENAYELLHWFVLTHEQQAPGDPQAMDKFVSDQALFEAIWNAATVTSLSSRAVYDIRRLPSMLQRLEINWPFPPWWHQILATFTIPVPSSPAADGDEPPAQTEVAP